MKMSNLFVTTLRENPADAEVVSHQFLVRAGYMRKLASGIYTFLPLMWRVIKKIENIVREEMDRAGAQELLMPVLQPEELWRESGRWDVYGKELMRLKDRHDRTLALGPTHEEVITALVRDEVKTYRRLPLNLYQIQSKFRDEIRPRFGLLRGREFIMKDAYSFDVDEAALDVAYNKMAEAYTRIFLRCGLETRMVQSDSGAIGGNVSHEFMVLTRTESGENDVLFCDTCDYAANSDRAESKMVSARVDGEFAEAKIVDTPNIKSIEDLSNFFNVPPSTICKTLVYIADGKPVLALIRGDRTVEETKLKNAVNAIDLRTATPEEIKELVQKSGFDTEAGFIGPVGINAQIVADNSVTELKNFIIGINQTDKHKVGVNWMRSGSVTGGNDEFSTVKAHSDAIINLPKTVTDIRLAEAGDICPKCNGKLEITKGIEVGNIFKLGTKYSAKMNAVYTDENGKDIPFVMGCYGIGITRTAAAAVERFHDEYGIKWPMSIAPYQVVIVPVNVQDQTQWEVANALYDELVKNDIEVVLDDRDERAGVKFKDADLIGFPIRITVGKTISEGLVELKIRSSGEMEKISKDEVLNKVKEIIKREIV